MTQVELRAISKRYLGAALPAVDQLSLHIPTGRIVALLGASGSGKTTLLKIIAGLLPPSQGDVLFDGLSVLSVPTEQRGAVMVFQNHLLFPHMTIEQNIAFGLKMRRLDRAIIRRRVAEMLEVIQLPDVRQRKPNQLSGGQQQRVALARALIIEPRLLLLDEPLSNLDTSLRDEMRELIRRVQHQFGITTIVVTHDQQDAVVLADKIALMRAGQLQQFATPDELFNCPSSESVARFFGGVNFLPGHAAGTIAQTAVGAFRTQSNLTSGAVVLTIRPEQIQWCAAQPFNTVKGVVQDHQFMGTHHRYRVRLTESEFMLTNSCRYSPSRGRRSSDTLPPAREYLADGERLNAMLWDCVVIGAGQAGLATGHFLKKAGLRFVLLERDEQVGGSWQHYYQSLKLFSPARYASLPGLRFPGDPNHYPTRDAVISYLQAYANRFNLPIHLNTRVEVIAQTANGFELQTERGVYQAKSLVSASGPFNIPYIPALPGSGEFKGTTLHAYQYVEPTRYAGQKVIVVGAGESAIQIARELATVAEVTLATRRTLRFVPQHIFGLDIHVFLHGTGYDRLPLGLWKQLQGTQYIIDVGSYRTALAAGKPWQRQMFVRFTEGGVVWADGEIEATDTVIFATGYRPGLSYLEHLPGALDEDGNPCHRGGVSTQVPGLFYVGLFGQRSHASATLRGVGADANSIVKRISRSLSRNCVDPRRKLR